ncbi:hypothetical protein OSB04_029315 [Centaurea solstitialis]|uniref:Uncharacterized protein n=1 Tax=Centaurea solstitialis TaxID=347529 RepID=A0AA38WA57_9ASTR|nr:hypothetical protein OSB04_029315 [Centaurea solstitialis]
MEELLKALKSEDHDESAADKDKFPIHDPTRHWKLKKPKVGEKYESAKQFKECVTYYALANGYSIWFEVSSRKKMIAKCGQRPERVKDTKKGKTTKNVRYPPQQKDGQQNLCKWRCYPRWMKKEGSFQVISLDDVHTCSRNFKYGSLINYKWIGKEFGSRIRMNPDIKLFEIADLVMKKYKL